MFLPFVQQQATGFQQVANMVINATICRELRLLIAAKYGITIRKYTKYVIMNWRKYIKIVSGARGVEEK